MSLGRQYKIYCLTNNLPSGEVGDAILFLENLSNTLLYFKPSLFHVDYYINKESCQWAFEYNYNLNIFYVNNNIWEVLTNKYLLKSKEISEIIKAVLEFKLKIKIKCNIEISYFIFNTNLEEINNFINEYDKKI